MTAVQVTIVRGPVDRGLTLAPPAGCGAVLKFEGLVRPTEGGEPIAGLMYEAYEAMAVKMLESLAATAIERFPGVRAVRVWHSTGFVPNEGCSFVLLIAAAHRKESLAAADWFIDEMKRDVPIWKSVVRNIN